MPAQSELGALLRAWRDRLQPEAVGLPSGRRRTAGLRREEVAMLAGLSVDYLVRLEQGRAGRPSGQVVSSLCRVLQLSEVERDQLYLSAGLAAPLPSMGPRHVPGSVQRLLARLPDVAIGVYTIHWTLLSANASWHALLGQAEPEYNLIEHQFNGTTTQTMQDPSEVERFERALVSDLRTASIRYPNDPTVSSLLRRLQANKRFQRLWSTATTAEHRSKAKTFVHPLVGEITLDCDVFAAVGTDLWIITYTATPGSEDASRLDLVRTLGVSATEMAQS